jgi:Ca2+-binding EF-hand superfamily protein
VYMKEIVAKNPIFSKEHIDEFFDMFNLYCDAKRQCDIADILNTARTLGFDRKYKIIYRALSEIVHDLNGTWIDFETFLTLLT